ncbi:MFS transporter [Isoptericola variabilis]|uniref:Major facilitator superfamily MFS_1 n=1 Tax=Isoptericola variabilis (strain 225) TaxID=743718 RepID=F6FTI8_ISOV2|nr:MFS transporter [Isoptericola variabilis]AEG43181.1 major facilitator superfamily MFS_1 [Isoptericola variabilis 225]TWH35114.1 MFS transporter [Isoptericola variabilis J7]
MTPLSPRAARRVFLLLTATRWFPVGLVVAVTTLLPLERGLSVTQTLTLASITGLVVFALELPTGGFADAIGRRPVLVAAASMQVLAATLFATAQSFWAFALAAAATGTFRALDSGPMEAWFVDTVHATSPGADVDRTLSHHGAVLGVSIALGALVSGGLVWWHPVTAWSALTLPYVAYAVLAVAHLVMVGVLLKEPSPVPDGGALPDGGGRPGGAVRRALASARRTPAVVADGVRLAGTNRVLLGLLLVEVFWSTGMVVFESMTPIRLAELLGSEQRAGALMGAVASVGWGVFALGAALAGLAARRVGVVRAAMAARVLNGLGAVWMGLVAGPAALVVAYLVTYALHGAGGPTYQPLLHREAVARNRSTVLSMASMTSFAAFAVAAPVLGRTAELVSTPVAMVIGGAVSVLGVLCFVPALRREKELDRARQVAVSV